MFLSIWSLNVVLFKWYIFVLKFFMIYFLKSDLIRKRFIICNFGRKNLCQHFWETTQNRKLLKLIRSIIRCFPSVSTLMSAVPFSEKMCVLDFKHFDIRFFHLSMDSWLNWKKWIVWSNKCTTRTTRTIVSPPLIVYRCNIDFVILNVWQMFRN